LEYFYFLLLHLLCIHLTKRYTDRVLAFCLNSQRKHFEDEIKLQVFAIAIVKSNFDDIRVRYTRTYILICVLHVQYILEVKIKVRICNLIQGREFVDKMEIQEMDLESIHVI
jgi:hypothetical protein